MAKIEFADVIRQYFGMEASSKTDETTGSSKNPPLYAPPTVVKLLQ